MACSPRSPPMRGPTSVALCALIGCSSSARTAPDTGGNPPDSPQQTDAPTPDGPPAAIPIKHVVVVVKENHTFDNYFGSFPGADGISQIQTSTGLITPPRAPDRTPRDLCHAHSCALTDWAGGAMNGWDAVS